MFGRNKKNAEEDIEEVEVLPRLSDEDADIWSEPGPRNYGEVDASDGYVDMGSILFPAVQGMQLRTQVADDGTTVLQILVVLGSSGIQMSVAAAPRSGGVWAELRDEIRAPFFTGTAVVEAARRARGRGIEVLLLDDRGNGHRAEDKENEARLRDLIVARATAALDEAVAGRVVVRACPAGRRWAATILTDAGLAVVESNTARASR